MNKNIDFIKNGIIAHRGYHDDKIPENSILAFKKAINMNITIELDIHILKDNNIVVFHDNNLKRMTGVNKSIKDTTYNEIKDLNLKSSDEKIPLFKDVLKIINGQVPIIIELKYDVGKRKLEKEVIKLLRDYKGIYAFQSFNPFAILYMKKHMPNIGRGQLVSTYDKSKLSLFRKITFSNMWFNKFTKVDFISYDIRCLPNKRLEKIKNTTILAWVVKDKTGLEKAKKYCDNFICENIDEIFNNEIKQKTKRG